MKTILGLILALAGAGFLLFNAPAAQLNSANPLFQEYTMWKNIHGKTYSGAIDTQKFQTWVENWTFVQEFNAKQTGDLSVAMNAFADLTNEQFTAQYLMKTNPMEHIPEGQPKKVGALPSTVDWVSKGAVTPVENQGQCGSCWAFSTKETLEGVYQIKTGNLVVLSAQQLTDCAPGSFGCNGGYQMSTYTYTQSNGIESEADYPYTSGTTGQTGTCTFDASKIVFKNTGAEMVSPRNNQEAIQAAVVDQPLSVLVAASGLVFQLYNGGVITSTACGSQTDHAILLTGYNSTASTPYYEVKNSWGTSWGEKGYAQIAMTGDGIGICAIQTSVAYPLYN